MNNLSTNDLTNDKCYQQMTKCTCFFNLSKKSKFFMKLCPITTYFETMITKSINYTKFVSGLEETCKIGVHTIQTSLSEPLKLCITAKRKSKAKYLTWNYIRLTFVKKVSMPNSVKSLGNIKCNCPSSPRSVKIPTQSIRYSCQKICSWSRIPKIVLEFSLKNLPDFFIYLV